MTKQQQGHNEQRNPPAPSAALPGKPENMAVALCVEAQADGVPCPDLGRKCEVCERAVQQGAPEAW